MIPDVPAAVSNLLDATRRLEEALRQWGALEISEIEVSDVFVTVGNCYNEMIAAFQVHNIDMRPARPARGIPERGPDAAELPDAHAAGARAHSEPPGQPAQQAAAVLARGERAALLRREWLALELWLRLPVNCVVSSRYEMGVGASCARIAPNPSLSVGDSAFLYSSVRLRRDAGLSVRVSLGLHLSFELRVAERLSILPPVIPSIRLTILSIRSKPIPKTKNRANKCAGRQASLPPNPDNYPTRRSSVKRQI
ncbi:hypothetical protein ACEPAF_907 [Sanghuangporus sanghuang]